MTENVNSTEIAARRQAMLTNPHWVTFSAETREIIIAGELALADQRARRPFDTWCAIGHACSELQQAAMRRSNSSTPMGRRYAEMYALIAPTELRDMDKGNRSRAIALYQAGDELRAWYDGPTNSQSDRDRMQHPQTILARFAAWQKREGLRPDEPASGRKRPDEARRARGNAAAIDDATERLHNAVDGIERKIGPGLEMFDFSQERIAETVDNFIEMTPGTDAARRFSRALHARFAPPGADYTTMDDDQRVELIRAIAAAIDDYRYKLDVIALIAETLHDDQVTEALDLISPNVLDSRNMKDFLLEACEFDDVVELALAFGDEDKITIAQTLVDEVAGYKLVTTAPGDE